ACPDVYGKKAYPGYAGEVLVDSSTGASYNSVSVNGQKYLLTSLFDPTSSQCSIIV
ncbi:Phosphate-induced protein, partial [Parasponia andersonii]